MRRVLLIVGLLIVAFCSVAFTTAAETVVYAQRNPITDLDPAYGAFLVYPSGYEAAYCIFEGLVTFDKTMNIIPALATNWEVQEDGRTWIFHIRHGVRFQDGTPFNADAVRINFERGMDPSRTTTNRALWNIWESGTVIDEYTFEAVTKKPSALVLNALAHGAGLMVSPKSIKDYDDHPEHHPVGTGPFMLENFKVGEELTLVAYPDYWGAKPQVDKLIFRYVSDASTRINALLTGAVDVIDNVAPHAALRLQSDPAAQVIATPALRPYTIHFLMERELFKDVRVRQALNYAIDKEAIGSGLFLGYAKPADSPLAFNTSGHAATGYYKYDPEKAKSLLTIAGWRDTDGDGVLDKNGKPFEFTVITPEGQWAMDLQVVEAVAAQLESIGVRANIMKVEPASFWGLLSVPPADATWDMAFFGFNPSNASGQYHLDCCYSSNPDLGSGPACWNLSWFKNAQVDELIAKAGQTTDTVQRNALLASAQQLIWDEAPAVWLVVPATIVGVRARVNIEVWPVSFTILRHASISE